MPALHAALPAPQPPPEGKTPPSPARIWPFPPVVTEPGTPGGPAGQPGPAQPGRPAHSPLHRVAWAAGLLLLTAAGPGAAAGLLGSAQAYAVLSGATVTNGHNAPNASTQVWGDLGVAGGTAITGFDPDGEVTGGSLHRNDASAQQAMAAAQLAYDTLLNLSPQANLSGQVLGGVGLTTLTPGVYRFDTSAQIDGALVLDFQGQAGAQFVFLIGSSLTAAGGASVSALNGDSGSSIYWQVGSSATLGLDSHLVGNVLAYSAVSLAPRASLLCGRVIGLTAGVTLVDNLVSSDCGLQGFGSGSNDFGSLGFSAAPVPEPASAWLLAMGGLALFRRRAARTISSTSESATS